LLNCASCREEFRFEHSAGFEFARERIETELDGEGAVADSFADGPGVAGRFKPAHGAEQRVDDARGGRFGRSHGASSKTGRPGPGAG
jgi:hypothetical protein